jgi:hypothetical protein
MQQLEQQKPPLAPSLDNQLMNLSGRRRSPSIPTLLQHENRVDRYSNDTELINALERV